jgi:hypothetical protein
MKIEFRFNRKFNFRFMNQKAEFAERLKQAMLAAGYEARPGVLEKEFNTPLLGPRSHFSGGFTLAERFVHSRTGTNSKYSPNGSKLNRKRCALVKSQFNRCAKGRAAGKMPLPALSVKYWKLSSTSPLRKKRSPAR